MPETWIPSCRMEESREPETLNKPIMRIILLVTSLLGSTVEFECHIHHMVQKGGPRIVPQNQTSPEISQEQ